MSRFQLYLLPVLAWGVFLLTGSMEQSAAPLLSIPGPAAAPAISPWAGEPGSLPEDLHNGQATEVLDRAIATCGPEKIVWLGLTFRQQVACDDIVFQMEGQFLAGPEQRTRYELKVTLDNGTSFYQVICDGERLAELVKLPRAEKQVSTVDLPKIQNPTDDPAAIALARQELLRGKTFGGIGSLLRSLRARLVEPGLRAVHYQGEDFLEIRGKWVVDQKSAEQLPADMRMKSIPRECRVYLDATNLWPRCIEWWGAASDTQFPCLLVQTIYDQPAINQPLTPEQAARAFSLESVWE